MLIASKSEEISPATVNDLVKISANAYTKEKILQFEYRVLSTLEFDITIPTINRFIERFSNLVNADLIN